MRCLCFSWALGLAVLLGAGVGWGQAFTPRRPFLMAAAAAGGGGATNLTADLYHWWKFDEGGTNNLAYNEMFRPNAVAAFTINTNIIWSTNSFLGPYAIKCTNFNGWCYPSCNIDLVYQIGQYTNVSITWWQYPNATWNSGTARLALLIDTDPGGHSWFETSVIGSGLWQAGWVKNNILSMCRTAVNATNYPFHTWTWYAVVWSATNTTLWMNAQPLASTNQVPLLSTCPALNSFQVGGWGRLSLESIDGFDELRIYTNSLSSNDLSYLYHSWYNQTN